MARSKNKTETAQAAPADYAILISPIVTEKTSGEDRRTVAFKVATTATKDQIRSAVERVFKVEVQAVRTVNVLGKVKRSMRSVGRRADSKKAYVTLKEGHTINLVEGV